MTLIKEKVTEAISTKIRHLSIPQEMLKGLCFNCDHRKYCTWKEDRKLFCEHFQ